MPDGAVSTGGKAFVALVTGVLEFAKVWSSVTSLVLHALEALLSFILCSYFLLAPSACSLAAAGITVVQNRDMLYLINAQ